jgi:hypothetical protein
MPRLQFVVHYRLLVVHVYFFLYVPNMGGALALITASPAKLDVGPAKIGIGQLGEATGDPGLFERCDA